MSNHFCTTALIGGVVLAGCSTAPSSDPAAILDISAFSRAARADGGDSGPRPVDVRSTGAPDGGAADDPAPPAPATSAGPALRSAADEARLVDSMVGQVNGRPIFAHEFFAPLEDQILALREELEPNAWAKQVADLVLDELRLTVINALFLAEAEADLKPEEQKGILSWLQQAEERLIAQSGGVASQARRKLAEEEGISLEGRLEEIRNEALIGRLLQERIGPRIIVTWRDKEREYARRFDEFNPPAKIDIGRIALRSAQADAVATVTKRLAAGDDFAEVAAAAGVRGDPVWQSFEVSGGDLAQVEMSNDVVKSALVQLRNPGDTVGPFEVGTRTWWLHVHALEQPPGRGLYDGDVQRELTQAILARRGTEERRRYVEKLLARGIYDEVNAMATRLLGIAIDRYGPPAP